MADKVVYIAKDPVKERLKPLKAKLKAQGAGAKLTQKEIEQVLLDIMEMLRIE